MHTTLFIDGSYLFQILRASGVNRLNYDLFGPIAVGGGAEPLVFLYETYPWPREGEEPSIYWERVNAKRRFLHAAAQSRRMRIRVPEPVPDPAGGSLPTGYPPAPDVLMAVDLVRLIQRSRIQRVVLIWANAAIVPAIEHARDEGIVVQLLQGSHGLSAQARLIAAVDEMEVLGDDVLQRADMAPARGL